MTVRRSRMAKLLLLFVLGEGRVYLIFLDAGGRIAGLTEILFFGAVAHHAGMRRGGLLVAVFGIGLAGHFGISGADACLNDRHADWFRR